MLSANYILSYDPMLRCIQWRIGLCVMLTAMLLPLPHGSSRPAKRTARTVNLSFSCVHSGLPESPVQVAINMQKSFQQVDGRQFPLNTLECIDGIKRKGKNLPL